MGLDIRHVVPSRKTPEIENLDYFTINEIKVNHQFFKKFQHLFIQTEGEELPVIFFKEIGYQRGCMNRRFYRDFENDKLYFERHFAEKAYHYIEANSNFTVQELQNNFQKHFVESFIEGESIFFSSW
jgi:hypothetical protein